VTWLHRQQKLSLYSLGGITMTMYVYLYDTVIRCLLAGNLLPKIRLPSCMTLSENV